jgi:GTP-binding protein
MKDAKFILSAAGEEQFIRDGRKTVVFAGRSNVGKSSVINMLTGRKALAKVGNTPGKTSHVNYFLIDGSYYLADLPGYGYAKVSHARKLRWAQLLEAFFSNDAPLRLTLGVLIVDIRHKPTALDMQMAQVFRGNDTPFVTLANKSDKLKPSQVLPALELIKETLEIESIFPISSTKGSGRKEVLHELSIRLSGH